MKAVVHFHAELAHQKRHAELMRQGLERQGISVAYGLYDTPTVRDPDFVVIWGAPSKQPAVASSCPRVLVMERGHVGDRMTLVSCGWDGLGRRGRYPHPEDGGARWRARHAHLLQPWSERAGYALLIGQVQGDAALRGLDLATWVRDQTDALRRHGWDVRYRPHPMVSKPDRLLAEDLAGAGLCVTYNSTTGVEAVLAGVPTITLDEGAMAWDVAGHALDELVRPDRDAWAHALAWTTWEPEEISTGAAWKHLAPLLEAPCPTA